jgi:outer membrane immunogenic protein
MCKRVLLASAGLMALTAAAAAADLPRRYEPPRQQIYAPAPIYNWTGFYIGINGGFGWGDSRWDSTGRFDVSGPVIGGTAGYNWQFAQWVLGLEGDLDWSNIKGTTTAVCPAGCTTRNSWLGTVRGRVGYSVDRFLPFITGGFAVGDIRASQPGFAGASDTNAGWTVGGGLEFVIAGNFTAKAEYLYVNLGRFNCGLACGNGAAPDNVRFDTHLVRGGVNYRF